MLPTPSWLSEELKTSNQLIAYDQLHDKVAGALLGAAVADGLAWPTEFIKTTSQMERKHGVSELTGFVEWIKPTGGRFNTYYDVIKPGEYSDDTQLTLSTARCIQADGSFDAIRFATLELPLWLRYARGAGSTMTAAARAIQRREATWDNNFYDSRDSRRPGGYVHAGANGAAMRVSPHAIANIHNRENALVGAFQNSIVTHGHPRAIWGSLLYVQALLQSFNWRGGDLHSFLNNLVAFVDSADLDSIKVGTDGWSGRWGMISGQRFVDSFEKVRDEVRAALELVSGARERPLEKTYALLGCLTPSTKGSGVGTVSAAIAVFVLFGGNYSHAVLRAANQLGSDTDTIGAMCGALVGALHGQLSIPDHWVNLMQDYGYFARAAEALTRIALRESAQNELVVEPAREHAEALDQTIVAITEVDHVKTGTRVSHPVFGLGWVIDASQQQIRRRSGGIMELARVVFDTGQSCVFHTYLGATS